MTCASLTLNWRCQLAAVPPKYPTDELLTRRYDIGIKYFERVRFN